MEHNKTKQGQLKISSSSNNFETPSLSRCQSEVSVSSGFKQFEIQIPTDNILDILQPCRQNSQYVRLVENIAKNSADDSQENYQELVQYEEFQQGNFDDDDYINFQQYTESDRLSIIQEEERDTQGQKQQQIDTNFKKVERSFEPPPPSGNKNLMTFQFPTSNQKINKDKKNQQKQKSKFDWKKQKSPLRLQYLDGNDEEFEQEISENKGQSFFEMQGNQKLINKVKSKQLSSQHLEIKVKILEEKVQSLSLQKNQMIKSYHDQMQEVKLIAQQFNTIASKNVLYNFKQEQDIEENQINFKNQMLQEMANKQDILLNKVSQQVKLQYSIKFYQESYIKQLENKLQQLQDFNRELEGNANRKNTKLQETVDNCQQLTQIIEQLKIEDQNKDNILKQLKKQLNQSNNQRLSDKELKKLIFIWFV